MDEGGLLEHRRMVLSRKSRARIPVLFCEVQNKSRMVVLDPPRGESDLGGGHVRS